MSLFDNAELLVCIGAVFKDKETAIREACRLLAEADFIDGKYAESMLKREQTKSTYLEGGIAIPHGNPEDSALIKRDALAVIQVPAGLDWGDGKKATLIVAIAAGSDGHLAILRRLVNVLKDKALMQLFSTTTDPSEIKKVLLQK